jgi:hypothetical protein
MVQSPWSNIVDKGLETPQFQTLLAVGDKG